jgi:hypothetical protein
MPTITTEFVHESTTYEVTGSADFYGPYAECEGVSIESIDPATEDAYVMDAAEDAIRKAAYEAHRARHGEPQGDPNDDYDSYSSGPDYWRDRESGEYRCG